MDLRPGRLKSMVDGARRAEGYITCHETLPYAGNDGVRPAVCRGFYDRYSTAALQIIERLWGWIEIDPPDTLGGVMPAPPVCTHQPGQEPPEPLYTPKETAHLFHASIKSVLRWDKTGSLPAIRLPNNHRRFRHEDIHARLTNRPLPVRDDRGHVMTQSRFPAGQTAGDGLAPGRGE